MLRLRHILVRHRYEAEDLLRLLAQGRPFAELATKHSQCPSASQGGDLGAMKEGRLDPDFLEAAQGLKTGEISSAPVRTRFGYHLIQRY